MAFAARTRGGAARGTSDKLTISVSYVPIVRPSLPSTPPASVAGPTDSCGLHSSSALSATSGGWRDGVPSDCVRFERADALRGDCHPPPVVSFVYMGHRHHRSHGVASGWGVGRRPRGHGGIMEGTRPKPPISRPWSAALPILMHVGRSVLISR